MLSSNDYLGLSIHPAVRRAAAEAALEVGAGSTGSRHRGRGLIFSTAPPPAAVAAATAAISVLRSDPAPLARLRASTAWLRAELAPLSPGGRAGVPILPLLIGGAAEAVAAEARLLDAGLLVQAVRPPTVPAGSSRLRITVSAVLDDEQLTRAASALLAALGQRTSAALG